MNIPNVVINTNNCMSRKNRKDGFHLQCPHKKKFGDFCGVHHNSINTIRIDQSDSGITIPLVNNPIPIVTNQIPVVNNPIPIITNHIPITYPINNITTPIPAKEPVTISVPGKKIILKKKDNSLYYTPSCDLSGSINSQKLLKTLQKYRINIIGDINSQVSRLKDFFANSYLGEFPEKTPSENLKKVKKFVEVSGEAIYNRSLCHNKDDFYSLDPIEDIPDLYFLTFSDQNNRIYCCDIRSFDGYIYSYKEPGQQTPFNPEDLNVLNPYDRQPLSKQSITNYLAKKFLLFQNGISCSHQKEEFDDKTAIKMKILDLFQIIYRFGYPVDHKWLLNLNTAKLYSFYLKLEDIWNYRLNLSPQDKKQIAGSNQIFGVIEKHNMAKAYKKLDSAHILDVCVSNIEVLITQGMTKNDCITGCNYILMALVEVSQQAAENLPQFAFANGLID